MGVASRCFWLDQRGDAYSIAARKWPRIVQGDERVPAFARQRVAIVEAIVDVDGRDVVGVVRLNGWRHDFDAREYLDHTRALQGV